MTRKEKYGLQGTRKEKYGLQGTRKEKYGLQGTIKDRYGLQETRKEKYGNFKFDPKNFIFPSRREYVFSFVPFKNFLR